jgi:hypothetical protein
MGESLNYNNEKIIREQAAKISALQDFVAADDALVTAEDYRMAGVMTQDEYDRIASRKREARNKMRKGD